MLINPIENLNKLKSLKLISYGTERMPEQVLNKLKKHFPQIKLLQTSVNELKIKNDKYELEMKQINILEINNFDNITKEDKDIKINKKCLPFL